ncbi:MAG: SDR family NAD(P)-dependent oxidoreductase [Rubellimicrobium sp.]|nr:SDR family NAD(P)-dependent oxidoreductase [Rubellimicrobium sp.]
MTHPALAPGKTAVITGGASGIGLAVARRMAALGMNIVIADLGADRIAAAVDEIATVAGAGRVEGAETDVSDPAALSTLEARVARDLGGTDVLMNNAAIQSGSAMFGPLDIWERVMAVNLWGVVHGSRIFGPGMVARGGPGLIVNTGSKQGITTPPGDPAYNMAKAGVKVFTEALAHEMRGSAPQIGVHLLIPGFVWTGLTRGDRTEKPAAAWTAEETADFMMESLERGDFYILCPDNDVPRALDEKRIAWAAGDIIENRPALSRWHPDHVDAFKAFVERN